MRLLMRARVCVWVCVGGRFCVSMPVRMSSVCIHIFVSRVCRGFRCFACVVLSYVSYVCASACFVCVCVYVCVRVCVRVYVCVC